MKRDLTRVISVVTLFALACVGLCLPARAYAEARTVRVGFYEFDGYHMIDENGEYSGYGYDYLQKLKLYANWKYEFVGYDKPLTEILEMLVNGDIDMSVSVVRTPERMKVLDFSDKPVCNTVTNLLVRSEDVGRYGNGDYDGMRIGALTGGIQAVELESFARETGFTYTLMQYDTIAKLDEALLVKKEVDAVAASSMRRLSGVYVVAHFGANPVYVAVRKGNAALLSEVNAAIEQVEMNYPTIAYDLERKYFASSNSDKTAYTLAELAYIDAANAEGLTLRALIKPEAKPYSWFEDGKAKGIVADMANEIIELTGLDVELVETGSREEYEALLATGEYPLCVDMTLSQSEAEKLGYKLTSRYYDTLVARLTNKNFDTQFGRVAAVSESGGLDRFIESMAGDCQVVYMDNAQTCVDAVKHGKYDAAYLLNRTAQQIAYYDTTNSLAAVTYNDYPVGFSIGVSDDCDARLSSIFDKASRSITEQMINGIVNSYIEMPSQKQSFISYLYSNPLGVIATMLVLFALGMLFILFAAERRRRIAEKARAYEYERFIGYVCAANDEVSEIDLNGCTVTHYTYAEGCVRTRTEPINPSAYLAGRVHADDAALVKSEWSQTAIKALIDNVAHKHVECRILQPDGTFRWMRFLLTGLSPDAKHPRNYMIMRRDIHGAKVEEEAKNRSLADALNSATQANSAKSGFLSRMSHEIRTPLNAISGYNMMMRDVLAETEQEHWGNAAAFDKLSDYLNKSRDASAHLLDIVNDVLDLSAIENGRMTCAMAPFCIRELVRNVTAMFFGQMQLKGVRFEVVANGVTHENLIGDRVRLNQIIINILGNASKFTKSGEVVLTVTQSAVSDGRAFFRFEIRDTGIGMSEETLSRIFRPFEQGGARIASAYGGTGLGLSITKNLIEMMHGEINVRSRLGAGSVFTVDMPFEIDEKKDTVDDTADAAPFVGIRAIAIDGDARVLESVRLALNCLGIECDTETSTDAALARAAALRAQGSRYDVCFMDWCVDGMNGADMVNLMRRQAGNDLPAIVVMSYDVSQVHEAASGAGIYLFAQKPVFVSEMRELLLSIYEEKQATEETHASRRQSRDFAGMHLLLVEDNAMNLEIAKRLLQKFGFIVDTACDGEEAVKRFCESELWHYAAILMDVQMPVMNGYEATRAIRDLQREDAHGTPIIAMTANAFAEDVAKSLSSGMVAHVSKPIDPAALKSTLAEFIGRSVAD